MSPRVLFCFSNFKRRPLHIHITFSKVFWHCSGDEDGLVTFVFFLLFETIIHIHSSHLSFSPLPNSFVEHTILRDSVGESHGCFALPIILGKAVGKEVAPVKIREHAVVNVVRVCTHRPICPVWPCCRGPVCLLNHCSREHTHLVLR